MKYVCVTGEREGGSGSRNGRCKGSEVGSSWGVGEDGTGIHGAKVGQESWDKVPTVTVWPWDSAKSLIPH